MPKLFLPVEVSRFTLGQDGLLSSRLSDLGRRTEVISACREHVLLGPDGETESGLRYSSVAFRRVCLRSCVGLSTLVERIAARPLLFTLATGIFNQVASASLAAWCDDYALVVDRESDTVIDLLRKSTTSLSLGFVHAVVVESSAGEYRHYETILHGRKMLTRFYRPAAISMCGEYKLHQGISVFHNEFRASSFVACPSVVVSPGPTTIYERSRKAGARPVQDAAAAESAVRGRIGQAVAASVPDGVVEYLHTASRRRLGLCGDTGDIARASWLRRQMRELPASVTKRILSDAVARTNGESASALSLTSEAIASKTFLDLILAIGRAGRRQGLELNDALCVAAMRMLVRIPKGDGHE